MNETYKKLFIEIVNATAVTAEKVRDSVNPENDEKNAANTAQMMHDDYAALYDKLKNNETLDKRDYARILVGALIIARNLSDRIKQLNKALEGYKVDVLPKLQRIIDECNTDEECQTLAEEIFQVKDLTSEKK